MRATSPFDSRTKARSLAFLFAAGAFVTVLAAVAPHDEAVPERTILITAAISLLLALAFLRFANRMTEPALHGALAAATVLLSVVIHYTEHATLYPLVYMWPALYAFFVFSTRAALGHLAFIGAAYATVLQLGDTMDATLRLVLVVGTPLVIGLLVARLLGLMRNALDRSERQERALRSSERRTREIIDSARDGFIATDADGRVLDINAAAERLLGRSRADVLGRPFQELGIPRDAHARFDERRQALLRGVLEDGTRHLSLLVSIDRPDGTRLHGETTIWVVEHGGALRFNARLTDIGDRLREQAEREQLVRAEAAREQAERAAATIAGLQSVVDTALTERDVDELAPLILDRTRAVLGAASAALLLLQDDGSLSLVTSGTAVTEDRPDGIDPDAGVAGRVLATRAPVLLHDPRPDDVVDPSLLEAGITSLLGVPLIAHETLIGVLEVGVRAPRRLGCEDADLLRLAADRVALAIDHARAYSREHRIAETLQRSLLPSSLPALPGVALGARYLPAASDAEVGGDWYDAIALTGGRVLLVMGDVSGKGLDAASTLGALRSAIRAYALEGHGPAQIAKRLNSFVLADASSEHMATLVLALFDPVESELRWVNAGHPPPLLLGAAGRPRFLEGARAVPLGVLPFPNYADKQIRIEPGGALVLYTDGLVERRDEHIDTGLARLARACAAGPLRPEAICERLLAATLPGGATGDDVALLALCHEALGACLELELPSEPSALSSLRALLRRWLAQSEVADVDVHAIVMASSEACTNAIEHAGAGVGASIEFRAAIEDGDVAITVRDHGRWRDGRPPTEQGRGLQLIEALMNDVELAAAPDGTTVRLRRRLATAVRA